MPRTISKGALQVRELWGLWGTAYSRVYHSCVCALRLTTKEPLAFQCDEARCYIGADVRKTTIIDACRLNGSVMKTGMPHAMHVRVSLLKKIQLVSLKSLYFSVT
jgi:hypothetical protein